MKVREKLRFEILIIMVIIGMVWIAASINGIVFSLYLELYCTAQIYKTTFLSYGLVGGNKQWLIVFYLHIELKIL